MKIREIKLTNFKRFTDLTVTDIPETARLVVLVGPNGCGKTSLFEALNYYYQLNGFGQLGGQQDYIEKKGLNPTNAQWDQGNVKIKFIDDPQIDHNMMKGKFYFRTAFRNEPDFSLSQLNKQHNPTENIRLSTLMENDLAVSANYQRLVSQTLFGLYNEDNNSLTVEQLREQLIGKIKNSLSSVFNDLRLSSIGDPLANGSFYFEKGQSKDFHYKNLSAGEKAVFDLLLDMIMQSDYYSDAIFCIDEPEAHMHTRLQSKVLRELYNLTPEHSQLWISTHSFGMLKEAELIENEHNGTVVFLDFGDKDFDDTETIRPAHIGKSIWNKFYDLAFADFSQLIAPKRIVFCEGDPKGKIRKNFDAQVYERIFGERYHDTKFISMGSCKDIEDIENKSITIVTNILEPPEIIKFIDRDDRSNEEINELSAKGIKTSKRRHIESYLLDDAVISKLCKNEGKSELIQNCLDVIKDAIDNSISREHPQDDIKSASGEIYVGIKRILGLTQSGNSAHAFLRDTIAPLLTEELEVYKELEREIFD